MPVANPLLGSMAAPQVATGYAKGITDVSDFRSEDEKSRDADGKGASVMVAVIVAGAVLFVVALRRGGFKDMVTV